MKGGIGGTGGLRGDEQQVPFGKLRAGSPLRAHPQGMRVEKALRTLWSG